MSVIDLLAGRLDDEVALVAVLDAQQLGAVCSASGPISCQSSAGCTTGISSSTAPARFISSRTMASTLRITRRPSGM